jgi:Leishmanolysin
VSGFLRKFEINLNHRIAKSMRLLWKIPFFLSLFVFGACLWGSEAKIVHECIHDQIAENVTLQKVLRSGEEGGKRKMETEEWASPRIEADYSNIESLMSDNLSKYNFIRYELMPSMIQYFTKALKVIPSKKFKVPSRTCNGYPVPAVYYSDGIEADTLVIVNYEQNIYSSYLAFASTCFLDGDNNNRPIVGIITFNINYISVESEDWDQSISVSIHEFFHLLGFSSSLLDFYVDEDGNTKDSGEVVKTEIVRGVSTNIVVLDEVVNVAKEHFGCSEIEGVELENQGDLSSRGSHWERRTLGNEHREI